MEPERRMDCRSILCMFVHRHIGAGQACSFLQKLQPCQNIIDFSDPLSLPTLSWHQLLIGSNKENDENLGKWTDFSKYPNIIAYYISVSDIMNLVHFSHTALTCPVPIPGQQLLCLNARVICI